MRECNSNVSVSQHLYSHETNYKAYNASSVRYKEGHREQQLEEYLIYGPSSISRLNRLAEKINSIIDL